jgi:hypothetical protein
MLPKFVDTRLNWSRSAGNKARPCGVDDFNGAFAAMNREYEGRPNLKPCAKACRGWSSVKTRYLSLTHGGGMI